ncbi:hypothetical protein [Nisaea sp.]|uniref:hypothetical protein n=1 Tax=Nisaea sp. TaxID=2024842 RepID=UPI00329958E5
MDEAQGRPVATDESLCKSRVGLKMSVRASGENPDARTSLHPDFMGQDDLASGLAELIVRMSGGDGEMVRLLSGNLADAFGCFPRFLDYFFMIVIFLQISV